AQRSSHPAITQAFVPLAFPPGETCQFDWSHEEVELGGVVQTITVNADPFAVADRLWTKTTLDPEEEKLRIPA
ncbi:hypothetical protein CCR95_01370, partial [Thiocystis minor]|nr:hypothetical protein [Thiocystis minor]